MHPAADAPGASRTDSQGNYATMVPAGAVARINFDASGTPYTSQTTADMTFSGPLTFNQTLGP